MGEDRCLSRESAYYARLLCWVIIRAHPYACGYGMYRGYGVIDVLCGHPYASFRYVCYEVVDVLTGHISIVVLL